MNGDIYKGYWDGGKRHGKGVHYSEDGHAEDR